MRYDVQRLPQYVQMIGHGRVARMATLERRHYILKRSLDDADDPCEEARNIGILSSSACNLQV
jgi:hypothetical protein